MYKNLFLASAMLYVLITNAVFAQNISGPGTVCAGEPNYYRAEPSGGTFKVWGIDGGTIVSGTIHTPEIQVVWDTQGTKYLNWVASPTGGGGPGGQKYVTVIEEVAPGSLSVNHPLGSAQVTASAGSPAGATQWRWVLTGFGYTSNYVVTTSTPNLSVTIPDSDAPGTVCVSAYFAVCGNYGPSTCKSFP